MTVEKSSKYSIIPIYWLVIFIFFFLVFPSLSFASSFEYQRLDSDSSRVIVVNENFERGSLAEPLTEIQLPNGYPSWIAGDEFEQGGVTYWRYVTNPTYQQSLGAAHTGFSDLPGFSRRAKDSQYSFLRLDDLSFQGLEDGRLSFQLYSDIDPEDGLDDDDYLLVRVHFRTTEYSVETIGVLFDSRIALVRP